MQQQKMRFVPMQVAMQQLTTCEMQCSMKAESDRSIPPLSTLRQKNSSSHSISLPFHISIFNISECRFSDLM